MSRPPRPSAPADPATPQTGTSASRSEATGGGRWTFLTNHAMVFACLAQDPEARLRDVADAVGITERAVQHIVGDLEAEGFLRRERAGRRNRYALDLDRPLRRPLSKGHTAREVVALVSPPGEDAPRAGSDTAAGGDAPGVATEPPARG